jgi:hypothetical protein
LSSLQGSFDLIVGVNTFRYCHRLRKEADCGKGIHTLLRPGGVCVVIDMNDRFPLFRSRLKRSFEPSEECYIPSLDEYASPLREAGLELIVKKHFCWIPHSAGPVVTVVGRTLTPLLNMVAQRFAMRSLVIAKRPVAPVR